MAGKEDRPRARVTEDDLRTMSDFGRGIAESLMQALDFVHGKGEARVSDIDLPEPAPEYAPEEIARIRQQLGMTQVRFARLMNVSPTSVENWESGQKSPGPASRRLIQLAGCNQALQEFAGCTMKSRALTSASQEIVSRHQNKVPASRSSARRKQK